MGMPRSDSGSEERSGSDVGSNAREGVSAKRVSPDVTSHAQTSATAARNLSSTPPFQSEQKVRDIAAEQTKLLYSQAGGGAVATLVNVSIALIVLRQVAAWGALVSWWGLMVLVTLVRLVLVRRYWRAVPASDQAARWQRWFVWGAGCAGLGWGAAGFWLLPPGASVHQFFLVFLLGGMAAGAVAVLAVVPSAYAAFAVATLTPLSTRLLLQGGETGVAMGVLSLIFLGFLLAVALRVHSAITESLTLRLDNLDLVNTLSMSEQRTASANVALRREIEERQQIEAELREAYATLEQRVAERTAELAQANTTLQREVSQRAWAEAVLQQERDLLQVTLASIGDAVIVTDAAATVTFLNPVAERLTGWSAHEAPGRLITEVFPIRNEQTRQEVDNPLMRVLREGAVVGLANHTVLVTRAGLELPIADSGAPIRGADGQVYGAVLVFRDASESRRAEIALTQAKEAAEAADRVKGEFLATMSHELRTPLSVILGYTDMLMDGALGELSPVQVDILRRVDRNSRVLFELINMVLDLNRLQAGRLPVDVQEVQVAELLAEIRTETQGLYEQSGLTGRWRVEGNLLPLQTDSGKLKVVIKNLLSNAVKFTKAGAITVAAYEQREGVEFSVTDTGIGIPPEAQTAIFEPFQQVDSSDTRSYNGSGLGLHIVQRLLELLGGRVTVESEVGQGSTFRVWVPREPPASV